MKAFLGHFVELAGMMQEDLNREVVHVEHGFNGIMEHEVYQTKEGIFWASANIKNNRLELIPMVIVNQEGLKKFLERKMFQ